MTLFDDREKAFEAKYQLDQETAFKITVRRDKLLGLWAAELMALTGDDAMAYAKSLIEAELDPGNHDVGHKVLKDLGECGIVIDHDDFHRRVAVIQETARQQVLAETGRK